jgi:hypothetical protein
VPGSLEAVKSPEHERKEIVQYMATQARDETVEHAEKLASERIFRRDYDVWDVHTDAHRWWVVTSPTNLYSQTNFKSMDDVLSYHVGLGIRLVAQQARQAPETPDSRLERTRRQWEQAAEAQNEADEAEEFQAVGMRCRETLVSFAHGMASDTLVPEGEQAPQASNFLRWSELIANAVAPGEHSKRLRGYLKAIAKETWEYASWLTHAKNATRFDGQMAVSATAHFLGVFETAIARQESGLPDRCPECGSYRVDYHEFLDEEDDEFVRVRLCEACDWSEEYERQPLGHLPLTWPDPPEGECIPGHGPMARLPIRQKPASPDVADAARPEEPPSGQAQ